MSTGPSGERVSEARPTQAIPLKPVSEMTWEEKVRAARQKSADKIAASREAAASVPASKEAASPGWQDAFPPEQRITPVSLILGVIPLAIVVFVLHTCQGRKASMARPPADLSRTSQIAVACPSQRGIELVEEAAPRGDGAVGATMLVNNCRMLPAGASVTVLQAVSSYMLVREKANGAEHWVIGQVAFRN